MTMDVISPDAVVAGVLARWPQTAAVFLRRRLICVGCAMSRFETLGEIAAIYGLDLAGLLRELQDAREPAALDETEALMTELQTLDVRPIPPAQRHPLIFQAFEALGPGAGFILINDHDPKPLFYQFKFELEGRFTWDYVEQGPETWRVRIGKPAPGATS